MAVEKIRPYLDLSISDNWKKEPLSSFYYYPLIAEEVQDGDATKIYVEVPTGADYVEEFAKFGLEDPIRTDEDASIDFLKVKTYLKIPDPGADWWVEWRIYLIYGDNASYYAAQNVFFEDYTLVELQFDNIGGLPLTYQMLRNTEIGFYFYAINKMLMQGENWGGYYPQPPQGVPT